MYDRKMFHIFGILVLVGVSNSVAEECNYNEFRSCVKELVGLNAMDFNFVSEEHMKEVCNIKRKSIQCASNFINNCVERGHRELYEASIGGNLKVVEDMCTDGSKINKGFIHNMECFRKLKDEIAFCNDKLEESQTALVNADMVERLKVFYGCCAFEWHRNCLAKSARAKCNDEAADFAYHVATAKGGNSYLQLCSSSYSSCHGLHGVSEEEIDEKLDNISSAAGSMTEHFLNAIFMFLKRALL